MKIFTIIENEIGNRDGEAFSIPDPSDEHL